MELYLRNGAGWLWQWDTGQQVGVRFREKCTHALVTNGLHNRSLRVPIQSDGSNWVVKLPDVLLQDAEPITVHICEHTPGGITTRLTQTFPVVARPKPYDYVYTPEEVQTWEALAHQIQDINTTVRLLMDRITALERLPAWLEQLEANLSERIGALESANLVSRVTNLENAASNYVQAVNDVEPDDFGVARISAADIDAQAATYAPDWSGAAAALARSNLVHVAATAEGCTIPSGAFPLLILRGEVAEEAATLNAFAANGTVWAGSIDLSTGEITLTRNGST